MQFLADVFWSRWKREYLPQLQRQQKWFSKSRSYKVGDLVIVNDVQLHRNQWPLARIVKVYRNDKGVIGVVRVAIWLNVRTLKLKLVSALMNLTGPLQN